MKKILLIAAAACVLCSADVASADSFAEEINKIDVRAYKNYMSTMYPSPFEQHWRAFWGDFRTFVNTDIRGFVNNTILQEDRANDLLDQLVDEIVKRNTTGGAAFKTTTRARLNADLVATNKSILASLTKLGVNPPPAVPEPEDPAPQSATHDYSNFNSKVGP